MKTSKDQKNPIIWYDYMVAGFFAGMFNNFGIWYGLGAFMLMIIIMRLLSFGLSQEVTK